MSTETIHATLRKATKAIPPCPRAGCSVCGPGHRHHWYLDFGDAEDWLDENIDSEPGEPTRAFAVPDDAQACICKHCDARVLVSIDAEDLPEI